jgi:hypothetical protein
MSLSTERLAVWELCPRRAIWTNRYATRVSLMGALYRALNAGLTAEKSPEQAAQNELLAIASNPGLDIYGGAVARRRHFSSPQKRVSCPVGELGGRNPRPPVDLVA